jgi:hypothetical protein
VRNLYADLGFDRIEADPTRISRALARTSLTEGEGQNAVFILQDPAKKARYDWVLGAGLQIAQIRTKLGLRPDEQCPSGDSRGQYNKHRTNRDPGNRSFSNSTSIGVVLVSVLLFGVGLAWNSGQGSVKPPVSPTPQPKRGSGVAEAIMSPVSLETVAGASGSHHDPRDPVPGLPLVRPPEHGWMQVDGAFEPKVPWRIESAPGQDYFLTLREVSSGRVATMVFLQGGKPFQGHAPEGEFELVLTCGYNWYGLESKFGPGTKVTRTGATYRVFATPDNDWQWELSLRAGAEVR